MRKTIKHGLSRTIFNGSGRDCIRELIRQRDNYTCQICGKKWENGKRRFDVHHLDCKKEKTRQVDDYKTEKHNMVTLCHKCHLSLPEHRTATLKGIKSYQQSLKRINNYSH